jgi:hypothetical protein
MTSFFSLFVLSIIWIPSTIANRVSTWDEEIEMSMQRNVKGKCTWKYSDNVNQSLLATSSNEFLVRKLMPPQYELQGLSSLPETFTLADKDIEYHAKLRGYSPEKWLAEKELRWEIPKNHPGQNKLKCLEMTYLAGKGKPVSYYTEFRDVDRAFYFAYINHGLVHASGAVGAQCGYYMGEECCENRWDYANKWHTDCLATFDKLKLPWTALWDTSLSSTNQNALYEGCISHTDLGLPYDGKVTITSPEHIPHKVKKLFVMPALWDYNFHHFVADSLGRMSHSIKYLKKHTDVMIHLRSFELYDSMHFKETKYIERVKEMRNRIFKLLGIEPNRIIYGTVIAEQVIIPRCMRCSYALSNPIEIRLLRRQLLQSSVTYLRHHNISIPGIYPPTNANVNNMGKGGAKPGAGPAGGLGGGMGGVGGAGGFMTIPGAGGGAGGGGRQPNPNRAVGGGGVGKRQLSSTNAAAAAIPPIKIAGLDNQNNNNNNNNLPAGKLGSKGSPKAPAGIGAGGQGLGNNNNNNNNGVVRAPPPKSSQKIMIILQRYTTSSTNRDWDDHTLQNVTTALQKHFPTHKQIIFSSQAASKSDYCLACEIVQYARADILVGAHGAGLTNVMFLPMNALLIEIVGEIKDVNMPVCGYYGPLGSMVGVHHYLYVHSTPTNTSMNADIMAQGAAKFYSFIKSSQKNKDSYLRETNVTAGPISCRP